VNANIADILKTVTKNLLGCPKLANRSQPLVGRSSPYCKGIIASLACVRLTGWPVVWNWRHAILSADAGLLVLCCKTVFSQTL